MQLVHLILQTLWRAVRGLASLVVGSRVRSSFTRQKPPITAPGHRAGTSFLAQTQPAVPAPSQQRSTRGPGVRHNRYSAITRGPLTPGWLRHPPELQSWLGPTRWTGGDESGTAAKGPGNQRSTQRWVAAPGGELKCPSTAANGIGVQPVHASFTGSVECTIHHIE